MFVLPTISFILSYYQLFSATGWDCRNAKKKLVVSGGRVSLIRGAAEELHHVATDLKYRISVFLGCIQTPLQLSEAVLLL